METTDSTCSPSVSARPVARLATLGLGSCPAEDDQTIAVELLIALGVADLAALGARRVAEYLADIATHLLRFGVSPVEGSAIARTSIALWSLNAVVFDVPRGESEEFERFVADGVAVRLVWAVPVYEDEARLVERLGIEAFDELVDRAGVSLADVRRPSLVAAPSEAPDHEGRS